MLRGGGVRPVTDDDGELIGAIIIRSGPLRRVIARAAEGAARRPSMYTCSRRRQDGLGDQCDDGDRSLPWPVPDLGGQRRRGWRGVIVVIAACRRSRPPPGSTAPRSGARTLIRTSFSPRAADTSALPDPEMNATISASGPLARPRRVCPRPDTPEEPSAISGRDPYRSLRRTMGITAQGVARNM